MATDNGVRKIGDYTSSADNSGNQFCLAKFSGARTLTVVAAATDKVEGVIYNKPVLGDAVELAIAGEVKVKAGAAFAAGVELMADASGRVILAATTGNWVIGRAVEAATAVNQLVSVALFSGARLIP